MSLCVKNFHSVFGSSLRAFLRSSVSGESKQYYPKFFLLTIFAFGSFLSLFSCSSNEKKGDTAEAAYSIAEEYDKDERYDEAIRRYQEVKNKFAYSRFATKAELAIADCYFKQESFAEAQVSYQSFKDLHPKHPQIDYVTYRLALSYFKQLPTTIDRDLTLSSNAILYFDEVETRFPSSEFVKDSKEKKTECVKKLAAKEEYIADFYYKRSFFDSALARYEGLYQKYPDVGFDAKALSRSAICSFRVGDLEKARNYLKKLQAKFPDSKEAQEALREIK